MLYPYKYPKAKIQQLQSFVNYIMLEVVLRAKKIPDSTFSVELVIPKYAELISNVNAKYIFEPISNMFIDSKKLDCFHLKILRKAVLENNRIEDLCDGKFMPVRYKYLNTVFTQDFEKDMLKNIKTFCVKLYEKCLYLAPVNIRYGDMKRYYDLIVQKDDRCHFCGVSSLTIKYESNRNAFDHYLAKQTYPFVSVNFKNLVPACSNCNNLRKGVKDVLLWKHKRVKAFYPYTKQQYSIQVKIKFKEGVVYSNNLVPSDFDLLCVCEGYQEQVDNWMRVYDIEEHFKAKCCGGTVKSKLSEIMDFCKIKNMSVETILQHMENNLEHDMNFLKVPFFRAALLSICNPSIN